MAKKAVREKNTNVFLNFHDQRRRGPSEVQSTIQKTVERIPPGNKVVLVLSKDQFGKVQIPLDIGAAEIIA